MTVVELTLLFGVAISGTIAPWEKKQVKPADVGMSEIYVAVCGENGGDYSPENTIKTTEINKDGFIIYNTHIEKEKGYSCIVFGKK